MIIDNKHLAALKVILEEQGLKVKDGELESMGVKVARLVLLKEFLKLRQEQTTDHEL